METFEEKVRDGVEQAYRLGVEDAKPKWISVDDRLPSKTAPYAVKLINRDCPTVRLWVGSSWACLVSGRETITHWCNLPD